MFISKKYYYSKLHSKLSKLDKTKLAVKFMLFITIALVFFMLVHLYYFSFIDGLEKIEEKGYVFYYPANFIRNESGYYYPIELDKTVNSKFNQGAVLITLQKFNINETNNELVRFLKVDSRQNCLNIMKFLVSQDRRLKIRLISYYGVAPLVSHSSCLLVFKLKLIETDYAIFLIYRILNKKNDSNSYVIHAVYSEEVGSKIKSDLQKAVLSFSFK